MITELKIDTRAEWDVLNTLLFHSVRAWKDRLDNADDDVEAKFAATQLAVTHKLWRRLSGLEVSK